MTPTLDSCPAAADRLAQVVGGRELMVQPALDHRRQRRSAVRRLADLDYKVPIEPTQTAA